MISKITHLDRVNPTQLWSAISTVGSHRVLLTSSLSLSTLSSYNRALVWGFGIRNPEASTRREALQWRRLWRRRWDGETSTSFLLGRVTSSPLPSSTAPRSAFQFLWILVGQFFERLVWLLSLVEGWSGEVCEGAGRGCGRAWLRAAQGPRPHGVSEYRCHWYGYHWGFQPQPSVPLQVTDKLFLLPSLHWFYETVVLGFISYDLGLIHSHCFSQWFCYVCLIVLLRLAYKRNRDKYERDSCLIMLALKIFVFYCQLSL